MKRILCIISLFCFYSCSIELLDKNDFIRVYPSDKLVFQCEASSVTLNISSEEEWVIGDCPEWVSATPMEGGDGEELLVAVSANMYNTVREGVLTINSGSASIDINITQNGIPSDYIDLKIEEMANSITYSEDSGKLTIVYDETPPHIESGKAIVLTEKYGYDIRVIDSVSVSDNTLILQTSKGSMENLFKNTSFTLSTSGVIDTRNTTENMNVITPSEMGFLDEDGKYHTVYTRASSPTNNGQELWSFSTNFNGNVISENNAGKLYWETCSFDAGFNGVFSFDFGEQTLDDGRSLGDMQKFSYVLNGQIDIDFLLHCCYEASAELSSVDEIIAKNIIPPVVFKFMVGTIPVFILVNTHIGKNAEFSVDGNIDVSTGVTLGVQGNIGLEWTKNSGVKVINSVSPSLDIHGSQFLAKASASAKVSYYPHVDMRIYNIVGPWMEFRPYLKEVVEVGTSLSSNNSSGWQANTYAGLDIALGLGGSDINVWESEMLNPIEETLLFEAPKRITLLSPSDGIKVELGETVDAEFLVEAYSPLTGEYYPCPYALVNFEVDKGVLEQSTCVSNAYGRVYARWTPYSLGHTTKTNGVTKDTVAPYNSNMETHTMSARIQDQCGDVIDEAMFTINAEKEPVLIKNISGTYKDNIAGYLNYYFAIICDYELVFETRDVNESYEYLLAYRINDGEFISFVGENIPFQLERNTAYKCNVKINNLTLEDFGEINYDNFIATLEYKFCIWCKTLNCPVSPWYSYTLVYDEKPSIIIESPVLINEEHTSGRDMDTNIYTWEAPVKMTGQLWLKEDGGKKCYECDHYTWDYHRGEEDYQYSNGTGRSGYFSGDINYKQIKTSSISGNHNSCHIIHFITDYKLWIEYQIEHSGEIIKTNAIQYRDDFWDHI